MELKVGDPAPDFTLKDDQDRKVRLAEFRGMPVVLFFYPEDDTPGCTQQACGFRDEFGLFQKLGAVVFGISPDPVEAHAAFKKKFALPYRLLSDPERGTIAQYGAWGPKSMYGQSFEGLIRSSVLILPDGRIGGIFRNVRTEGNGRRMAEALEKLL